MEYDGSKRSLPGYIQAIAPNKKLQNPTNYSNRVPNELILNEVIEEENADLVVLCAYGKGLQNGNFIGSTL